MTAPPDPPDERPILFVGDIQGCARELALLLEQAGFRTGIHRLLPLGDVVNRGPDSTGVLALLRAHGAEPILGNHERALLEIHRTGTVPDWARAPQSAYVQLTRAGCWERSVAEMAAWPLWREGPGWIAVHAGLHPRLAPGETPAEFLTEVRWCDAQGHLLAQASRPPLEAPPGFRPWWEYYRGQRTVVFAHWAQRGLVRQERLWGLDTGCVYGGRLTGLWWPTQRLVQVEALETYLPVGRMPQAPSRPGQG